MNEPADLDPTKPPPEEPVAALRRRAVRGGAVLMVTRLVTQVFVWASTLLIAIFLTPSDYGLMAIGLLLVGLADLFAEAGVSKALIQKETLEPRDVDEAFTLNLALALAMYALLFALAGPLALFYGTDELPAFLRVLGIHVLLAPFMSVPLALLDRSLSMGKQSVVHFVTAVIQSAVVLGLAIAGMGYWSLVAGSLGRRLLEVLAYVYGSGWRPRLALPTARAQGLLRFGIHVSVGTLLWYLYSNVDFAFVLKFSGQELLGFYAIAFQLTSLPAEKLTASINKVAFPTFSRLQSDLPRLHDWFTRLLVLLGLLGMPVMAGMALVADDGITAILGDKWRGAIVPFRLLSLAGLFKIYASLFPTLYFAVGRPDLNFKFNLACAIVFPVSYLVAGWLGGMIGICLVWLVVYPLAVLALVQCTRHVTSVGLGDLLRSQRAIVTATAFMAALVLALQWATADFPTGLRLVLAIVVGVVAYAGAMLSFCRHTVLADATRLWRELRN